MTLVVKIQSGVIVLDIKVHMKQSTCRLATAFQAQATATPLKEGRMGTIDITKA
jgi:hypothetical protein